MTVKPGKVNNGAQPHHSVLTTLRRKAGLSDHVDFVVRETELRSIFKTVGYRVFSSLLTGAITYAKTGELKTAALVGGLDAFMKTGFYYVFERAATHVQMGYDEKNKEKWWRSFAKTVLYRIGGSSVTGAAALIVTRSIDVGLTVGGWDAATKSFLYYGFERACARIPWGYKITVLNEDVKDLDPGI